MISVSLTVLTCGLSLFLWGPGQIMMVHNLPCEQDFPLPFPLCSGNDSIHTPQRTESPLFNPPPSTKGYIKSSGLRLLTAPAMKKIWLYITSLLSVSGVMCDQRFARSGIRGTWLSTFWMLILLLILTLCCFQFSQQRTKQLLGYSRLVSWVAPTSSSTPSTPLRLGGCVWPSGWRSPLKSSSKKLCTGGWKHAGNRKQPAVLCWEELEYKADFCVVQVWVDWWKPCGYPP